MTKSIASKSGGTVEVLEAADSPAVVEPSLTLIIATEKVRQNAENKVAHLMADNALHSVRQEKSAETLAAEYVRVRRMFPATDAVQGILGEDAPDLAGRTPAYKDAVKRMNETARDEMIAAFRKEGMTIKGATASADVELERIRKSTSRSIRLAVEQEAKVLLKADGREAAATFILGHGFGYSGEVGKAEDAVIQAKSWKLDKGEDGTVRLALPEGKVIGEDGRSVVDANQQAEPTEQSDQATPTETAEAEIAAAAEAVNETLTNPLSRLNFAVGEVRTAAQDKRTQDLTSAEGRGCVVNLLAVVSELILSVGPNLTQKDRATVASKLQAMGATALIGMELASK
jgi:hypothetical protein